MTPARGHTDTGTGVEVLDPGLLSTLQDLGRPGLARIGVGASGAADQGSFRLANRLVGNAEGAAAIESTFGGLVLRTRAAVTIAVTGALCPLTVDAPGVAMNSVAMNSVVRLPLGAILRLGPPERGLRSYVAVRGGFDVEPVLGSRATDLLAGLGPPVLAAGAILPIGKPPATFPTVDVAPVPAMPGGPFVLTVAAGPRQDWFDEGALDTLLSATYEVTANSNRVGIRLAGPELRRSRSEELPSEGTVAGALQVSPSGRPTLFLADHPVTGGYPVIAVVMSADVGLAAQARPGQLIRFQLAPPERTASPCHAVY